MSQLPEASHLEYILASNTNLQQFQVRLQASPFNKNRYYLGLLLMWVVSMPCPRIQYIRTLIKYGADVNFIDLSQSTRPDKAKSVFMIACQKSVCDNVRFLLSREDLQVGAVDANGENALHYALRNQREDEAVKIIQLILKQFPHLVSSHPKSFLFSAIESQKHQIIEFLLSNYLDSNEQTEPVGQTALQYTISLTGQLSLEAIKSTIILLLKLNADPRKRNFLSQDSYDYADRYLFDLEELVEKYYASDKGLSQKMKDRKCYTVCTYEDTGTTYSKDQDCFNGYQNKKEDVEGYYEKQIFSEVEYEKVEQKTRLLQGQFSYESQAKIQEMENLSEQQSSCQQEQTRSLSIEQFHCNFSAQILSHSQPYIQEYNQASQDISVLWQYLLNIGDEHELSLEVIGSFATRLWTAHSDIDLVYINQKSSFVHVGRLLEKIHKEIRARYRQLGISQMFLNLDTKFPNIKLKMNEQHHQRRIEISIFQRKCSGRKYVQFINEYISYYPAMVPLFYFLHHLLQTFNLHKPTKNGLKTYTIFLIILSVVQGFPGQSLSVSELLINLIYYYNNCYEYSFQQISQCNPSYKPIFNMMDPLNVGNNTGGKETDTERLRTMFKAAGYALGDRLKAMRPDSLVSQILQLHRMFQ